MNLNLSSSLEDCLEAIYRLSEKEGNARISDIAIELGIAKPSVTETVTKLEKLGLVIHKKYRPVKLTVKGKEIARHVDCVHKVIKNFLTDILGVNPQIAEEDACAMEHVISGDTLKKLIAFIVEENKLKINKEVCLCDLIEE